MFALMNDPPGSLSAHSKFKKPRKSNCLRVESMAVGVEMKRMMMIVRVCRKSLLNRKRPLFDPPRFFHKMSIGSLAMLTSKTYSLTWPNCWTYTSISSNLMNVDCTLLRLAWVK